MALKFMLSSRSPDRPDRGHGYQKIIFTSRIAHGVLITDHNVRETLRITDRAYIAHDGVIFKNGTPDNWRPTTRCVGFIWGRVPIGLK